MNKTGCAIAGTLLLAFLQDANAIEYKRNSISGGGGRTNSSSSSFFSTHSFNGSNVTSISNSGSMPRMGFSDFDWSDHGLQHKTLDQRIREAEQKLNKLCFIRDVCRNLEDEIRISFERKSIPEVLKQVSGIIGTDLPFETPEGTYIVEKSDVSGMRTDQFLNTIAEVCGLTLKYEKTKLVFVKPEAKKSVIE